MVVFELNSYARASHTPDPFLGRGDLRCCVLVGNEWFEWGCFPSREGIKGCVMMSRAVWAEILKRAVEGRGIYYALGDYNIPRA